MDDRHLLSRHKPHPTRRGIKKPRARSSTPGREPASEFTEFGERARREFANSSSPMRIFDHETMKYLAVNDAAVKFYGYTREEFLAMTLRDTRHPDEHAVQRASLEEPAGYFRHGKTRRQIRKSGEIAVVETVTHDILFDGRKARLSLTIDVTERKRAEQALRESEERFRQLAENIREVFWISTPAGDRIVYISPGYEEIWGRSCESLYRNPRSWTEQIRPEDLPAVRDFQEKYARGQHADVEYRVIHPDGTLRWIRDRTYPMRSSDGTLFACGIAEDITKLKQAEQERLTQAIHQRDALVREVHHRIKNSLQGVAGLLRQKIGQYPAMAPGIEEAIAQLQSVALVYGLQETRPDGLLSLAEIMNAICSSAESLLGGRVERAFERKSQRPACLAGSEAVSVAVALNELVFNALKHQPAKAGEKHARIVLRETADEAEIRIANRGRLPAGFDYPGGRSTGSGLELVRTLLASPGGTITFNGAEGEVEVVLKLGPPLLAGRQKAVAR